MSGHGRESKDVIASVTSVTFDSNVWENIVIPEKLTIHPESSALTAIKEAIELGRIKPVLSDAIVLLEAIQKKSRSDHFNTRMQTVTTDSGNAINIKMSLEQPDVVLSEPLKRALSAAIQVGFKFIKVVRIAHPQLQKELYLDSEMSEEERIAAFNRTVDIAEKLDELEFGYGALQPLVDEVRSRPEFDGLSMLEITALGHADPKSVASAVAEWADVDALAAHAGYQIDYFCTLDEGRGAGEKSILHYSRRQWLKSELGIEVVTPSQLVSKLSL